MHPSSLKITHFIGSTAFGGIERMVLDLAVKQQKSNQVSILVGQLKGDLTAQFQLSGLSIEQLQLKSGFDFGRSKRRQLKQLFADTDIIHLHGFHPLVAMMAERSGKKIVYTEHGNFGFGRKLKFKDHLLFSLRRRFFYRSEAAIVCNSAFNKAWVEKHFYKGKRLRIIYNGTQITTQANPVLVKQLRDQFPDQFIISTTARLAQVKRIDRLLEVFALFLRQKANAVLWIVGDGPERENLEAQAKSLQLGSACVFMGYQAQIVNYQSACHLTIIPSQNESFGLTAIEHYSQHKPVLVFADGGGLTEIVARIEPDDICADQEEMLERMLHYASKPELLVPSETLAYFSLERMEQEYNQLYQQLTHVRH